MKRALVIIDGSNFYHGSKHLCPDVHLTGFDYRKLAEMLVEGKAEILYCVGEIKRGKDRENRELLFIKVLC